MNYGYIKSLKNRIHKLNAKIAALEDSAVNISPTLSSVPVSSGSGGEKLQTTIESKIELERERDELRKERLEIIASIPRCYEGDIIRMKVKGRSWKAIAREVTGDEKDHDALRKMVKRFKW